MDEIDLRLKDVSLVLGGRTILSGINLKLTSGIHCFLGPNGAGKTMTNRILALIQQVSSGKLLWNGEQINPFTDNRREYIMKIGYMRQEPVFLNRTVWENIALPLHFRQLPREVITDRVQNTIEEFNLEQMVERRVMKLSTGQKQRVALARTMIVDPDLLILDEPTASLDMNATKWFENHILRLQDARPRIVIWTTHDQFQTKRLASTVSIIIKGKIRDTGSVEEVLEYQENPILSRYLQGELIELD